MLGTAEGSEPSCEYTIVWLFCPGSLFYSELCRYNQGRVLLIRVRARVGARVNGTPVDCEPNHASVQWRVRIHLGIRADNPLLNGWDSGRWDSAQQS